MIKLGHCPEAIQKVFRQEAGDAPLTSVRLSKWDALGTARIFTGTVKNQGKDYEIKVVYHDNDRSVTKVLAKPIEENVPVAAAPAAVQATLRGELGSNAEAALKDAKVAKAAADDRTIFRFADDTYTFTIAADGVLLAKVQNR